MASLEEVEILLESIILESDFQNGRKYRDRDINPYCIVDDVAVVRVFGDKYFILDSSDWENFRGFSWYCDNDGYARTAVNGKNKHLHQLLIGLKNADHIDKLRWDNRRSNLRRDPDDSRQRIIQSLNKNRISEFGVGLTEYRGSMRLQINIKSIQLKVSKSWSFRKYGRGRAIELAKEEKRKFIQEHGLTDFY